MADEKTLDELMDRIGELQSRDDNDKFTTNALRDFEKLFHLLTIPVEIVGYPAGSTTLLNVTQTYSAVAISVFDEIYHSMAKETGI